jgi:hypothetical protein
MLLHRLDLLCRYIPDFPVQLVRIKDMLGQLHKRGINIHSRTCTRFQVQHIVLVCEFFAFLDADLTQGLEIAFVCDEADLDIFMSVGLGNKNQLKYTP